MAGFPAERLAGFTLRERPELRGQAFSAEFAAAVPEFMRHDPVAALYYADRALDRYLDFVLVGLDRDDPGRVIARAVGVPFAFGDAALGRTELPDDGVGRGHSLGACGLARRADAQRGQRAR